MRVADLAVLPREGMCHRVDSGGGSMRWYALRCDTSGELAAMQAVCIGGLQAFVPMECQQVRVGPKRRPKTIRTVMLPGYVLAKMPHGYAARHVPIVRGVVCMDGEPIPLPEADVLDLMQASASRAELPTRKERQARSIPAADRGLQRRRRPFSRWPVPDPAAPNARQRPPSGRARVLPEIRGIRGTEA